MKQVVQAVDIELSKEETKILYKAKIILKELQVNLRRIEVKRQPSALNEVNSALEGVHNVMGSFGAWLDADTDAEVSKLDEKYQKLEEEE
jgi:hypothetical protein